LKDFSTASSNLLNSFIKLAHLNQKSITEIKAEKFLMLGPQFNYLFLLLLLVV
jgi:hypothetical protein